VTQAGAGPRSDAPALRTVEEHLAAVLDGVALLPAVELPLLEALDLVCAVDVRSPLDLPRFDNSAMDGYAVVHADVAGLTGSGGTTVTLPVVGEIGAGQVGVTELAPGQAAKIMTGAPLPAGADAVVPYEWTDRGVDRVVVDRAPELGQHVRSIGEDVTAGELLVQAGTVLGPRHLGLLASCGHATVTVRPRPRVLVVSTGTELREPGAELAPDSIYDGNSFLLAAAVRRAGAVDVRTGIVPDEPELFLAAVRDQLASGDVDLVLTSGGISMGDFDVVKAALRPLGTVWFGGVAMQPGKPQGFGHVGGGGSGAGDRGVPVVTLPGNPVSSYLSFELFVRPALRRMAGLTPESRTPVGARLVDGVRSLPGRRQFLRGRLTYVDEHRRDASVAQVVPVGGSGSHLVGDLAASDCLIVVPEDATEVAAGALVQVIRLEGDA